MKGNKRNLSPRSSRKRIGLTGGIGCGKSLALHFFNEEGAETLETDQIGRDLLESPEVRRLLMEEFGDSILDEKGRIDRASLASTVFQDSGKLSFLESVLHPRIREAWMTALAESQRMIVVEIPLLFEKSLESLFDLTVCLAAHPEIQQERLRARGYSDQHIQDRLRKQLSLDEKMARADVVLWNDGTREALHEQIRHLVSSISS